MARPIRIEYPGAVYHVTARGNERRKIFHGDKDRQCFLDTLIEAVEQFGLRLHLHGFCLMPNHLHLLVAALCPEIRMMMLRYFNCPFALPKMLPAPF
jgi:REP element-mobilizing transposase RayT